MPDRRLARPTLGRRPLPLVAMRVTGKLAQSIVRAISGAELRVAEAVRDEAAASAEVLGLTIDRVLKIRAGAWKGVFLCSHPVHGACVFKYVSRHSPLNGHHAHVGTAQMVRTLDRAMFPAILEIGENYTIEEFVVGTPVSELGSGELERLDFTGLLDQVRRFGEAGASGEAITRPELELILYKHINKLPISYYSSSGLSTTPRLLARRERIVARLRDVVRESDRLRLPRTLAVGDLGSQNVIVPAAGGPLRIIDVEHVGHGFWGFDHAWFLLTLTRHPVPGARLEQLFWTMASAPGISDLGASRWLHSLVMLLLEINASLGGHPVRRRSRALLARISAPEPAFRSVDPLPDGALP